MCSVMFAENLLTSGHKGEKYITIQMTGITEIVPGYVCNHGSLRERDAASEDALGTPLCTKAAH